MNSTSNPQEQRREVNREEVTTELREPVFTVDKEELATFTIEPKVDAQEAGVQLIEGEDESRVALERAVMKEAEDLRSVMREAKQYIHHHPHTDTKTSQDKIEMIQRTLGLSRKPRIDVTDAFFIDRYVDVLNQAIRQVQKSDADELEGSLKSVEDINRDTRKELQRLFADPLDFKSTSAFSRLLNDKMNKAREDALAVQEQYQKNISVHASERQMRVPIVEVGASTDGAIQSAGTEEGIAQDGDADALVETLDDGAIEILPDEDETSDTVPAAVQPEDFSDEQPIAVEVQATEPEDMTTEQIATVQPLEDTPEVRAQLARQESAAYAELRARKTVEAAVNAQRPDQHKIAEAKLDHLMLLLPAQLSVVLERVDVSDSSTLTQYMTRMNRLQQQIASTRATWFDRLVGRDPVAAQKKELAWVRNKAIQVLHKYPQVSLDHTA